MLNEKAVSASFNCLFLTIGLDLAFQQHLGAGGLFCPVFTNVAEVFKITLVRMV